MRGFRGRGSAWWYDGGSDWDSWGGWDGRNEGGIKVLFLRREL